MEWRLEATKLYGAVQSFEVRFGEYPPNFDDMDGVAHFVEKAFPHYKAGKSTPYPEDLDAAEALVFWLTGISTDPADPFAPEAENRHQFIELQASRVRDGRYYPRGDDVSQPYVYFAHASYDTVEFNGLRPYVRSQQGRVKEYCAPETAQIIAAGRDDNFGHGGLLSSLCEVDRDNCVGFDNRRVGEIEIDE